MGSVESVPTEDPALVERRTRNIKRMDQAVRKKLRGGVQFNMKVVIRGGPGTGKTSLWRRLQGQPLSRGYESTTEIQTATINWEFKNVDEAVKVEVWDCADQSDFQRGGGSSSISHCLDTSTVNVYQNAQAVIFMVNRSDPTSLDYVESHLRECPKNLDVLVLLNFRDISVVSTDAGESPNCESLTQMPEEVSDEAAAVAADDAAAAAALEAAAETAEGGERSEQLRESKSPRKGPLDLKSVRAVLEPLANGKLHCFECSMLNCFGLKLLYSYLNIPFLALKKRNLEQALRVLEEEYVAAEENLTLLVLENPYDSYLVHLQKSKTNPAHKVERKSSPQLSPAHLAKSFPSRAIETEQQNPKLPTEVVSSGELSEKVEETEDQKGSLSDEPQPTSLPADTGHSSVVEPSMKSAAGGELNEIGHLNEHSRENEALQDFLEDSDDDDGNLGAKDARSAMRGAADDDKEVEAAAVKIRSRDAGESDSDDDDEFYAAPKFGLTAMTPTSMLPPEHAANQVVARGVKSDDNTATTAVEWESTTVVEGAATAVVESVVTTAVEGASTTAVEGAATTVVEGESTTAVENVDTTTVEGAATNVVEGAATAAVEEEVTTAVEGTATAAIEGAATTVVESVVTTAVEGASTTVVEGAATAVVESVVTTAVEGASTTVVEGAATAVVESVVTTAVEGESTTAVENVDTTAIEGESTTVVEGAATAVVENVDTTAVEGAATEHAAATQMSVSENGAVETTRRQHITGECGDDSDFVHGSDADVLTDGAPARLVGPEKHIPSLDDGTKETLERIVAASDATSANSTDANSSGARLDSWFENEDANETEGHLPVDCTKAEIPEHADTAEIENNGSPDVLNEKNLDHQSSVNFDRSLRQDVAASSPPTLPLKEASGVSSAAKAAILAAMAAAEQWESEPAGGAKKEKKPKEKKEKKEKKDKKEKKEKKEKKKKKEEASFYSDSD